jgi:hypothetical protein
MQPVSKLCADHLRAYAGALGIKLKAAHAHEMVAALLFLRSCIVTRPRFRIATTGLPLPSRGNITVRLIPTAPR